MQIHSRAGDLQLISIALSIFILKLLNRKKGIISAIKNNFHTKKMLLIT